MSAVAIPSTGLWRGGYNREVLVPQLRRREDATVWRRLRRRLTAEMLVMGLGVLLATALMTSGGL